MESKFILGRSNLDGLIELWESSLPAWMILYCERGSAVLNIQFKAYTFEKGSWSVLSPDSFPYLTGKSEDFEAFFCIVDRDTADKAWFDAPADFYEMDTDRLVLPHAEDMELWARIFEKAYSDKRNRYRNELLLSLLKASMFDFLDKITLYFGGEHEKNAPVKSPLENVCSKFFNCLFDNLTEHRDVRFYADKLCITPCYLGQATREVVGESPKQIIDKQLIMIMKFLLDNSEKSIQQIAVDLHFPDSSYMCRFFRRETGQSMLDYRRRK